MSSFLISIFFIYFLLQMIFTVYLIVNEKMPSLVLPYSVPSVSLLCNMLCAAHPSPDGRPLSSDIYMTFAFLQGQRISYPHPQLLPSLRKSLFALFLCIKISLFVEIFTHCQYLNLHIK